MSQIKVHFTIKKNGELKGAVCHCITEEKTKALSSTDNGIVTGIFEDRLSAYREVRAYLAVCNSQKQTEELS